MRKFEKIVEQIYQQGMDMLFSNGNVQPASFIIKGKNITVIPFSEHMWSDAGKRMAAGSAVCEMAREMDADAVSIITECWMLEAKSRDEFDGGSISDNPDSVEMLIMFYMEADGVSGILSGKIQRFKDEAFVKEKSWKYGDQLEKLEQGMLHSWR